jgi:hypothetical protein
MLVRRLILAAAVAGFASFAFAPAASACVPPNCPGFGGCHVRHDFLESGRLIECYY